jgi:hypothetical protein
MGAINDQLLALLYKKCKSITNSPERGWLWVVIKIVLGESEYIGQPKAGKEMGE